MNDTHPPWRVLLVAGLAYTLLATAVTWPLLVHVNSRMPHDLGDPLLTTTLLWFNAHVTPLSATWWNGPWFHPAPGSLAFSDPRLGASLMATPLQWLGAGPVAAYNLTLLASFPLTALAAFALVSRLTGRWDAAAIAGLAFGFNPYRMAHTEHLELLLAYGMPLALYALHRYVDERRGVWLLLLAGALCLQGLSSSYYLLFFSVFMALWLLWFVGWRDWRALVAIAGASLAGILPLAPIYLQMWRIHQLYGFDRSGEVEHFSADVTSVLTGSPLLALWGWTSSLNAGEGQTFPGLTITLLAAAGAWFAIHRRAVPADRWSHVSRWLWWLSALVLLVGVGAAVRGPVDIRLGPLRLTITEFFKTFSIAALLAIVALLGGTRVRDAYRRRSVLAFYGLAAAALFLCSLGPRPLILGHQILYRPPYAWLMALPGFAESIRAPARFAMPAALALCVAGSVGFVHLTHRQHRRRAAWGAIALLGIAADTWPSHLPLLPLPAPWTADARDVAAVLELPLGLVEYDAAAMFRSIEHRMPTINGMSGALPPHYRALTRALRHGDVAALDGLGAVGPLLIAVRQRDVSLWSPGLDALPTARRLSADGSWVFYRLEAQPSAAPRCQAPPIVPVSIHNEDGAVPLDVLTDNDAATRWNSRFEGPASETLVIDLGRVVRLCGIGLSLGSVADAYPNTLTIESSADGTAWTPVHQATLAAAAIRGALLAQTDARIAIDFPDVDTRWLRLRRVPSEDAPVWLLAELFLRGRST